MNAFFNSVYTLIGMYLFGITLGVHNIYSAITTGFVQHTTDNVTSYEVHLRSGDVITILIGTFLILYGLYGLYQLYNEQKNKKEL